MLGLLRRAAPDQSDVMIDAGRVFLRYPVLEDWPGWARLRGESREFLQPWEPTWPRDALTRSAFRKRLKLQIRARTTDAAYSFLVIRRDDGALLGATSISGIRRGVSQAGTLGYWIGRPFARQGYMSEAVEAVIAHAFDGLGLHRLEASCLPDNEPSRRLLESRGFRREGFAPDYLRIDNAWRDHLLFGLLVSEWRRRTAAPDPPEQA